MSTIHVIKAIVDPSAAPLVVGQHWINTATNKQWFSKGTATVADWVEFTGVSDAVYGAGWSGSLLAPSQNALYNKIETIKGLTILPDATALSGTYDGDVLVQGDASLGANVTVHGYLKVDGILTNTAGHDLTVNGDCWVQKNMNFKSAPATAAGLTNIKGDLFVGYGEDADSTIVASDTILTKTSTTEFIATTDLTAAGCVVGDTITFTSGGCSGRKTLIETISAGTVTFLNSFSIPTFSVGNTFSVTRVHIYNIKANPNDTGGSTFTVGGDVYGLFDGSPQTGNTATTTLARGALNITPLGITGLTGGGGYLLTDGKTFLSSYDNGLELESSGITTIKTSDSTSTSSEVSIKSGNSTVAGDTGVVSLASGEATSGSSGNTEVGTGVGSTGSGELDLFTGAANSGSGLAQLRTGASSSGASGRIDIITGNALGDSGHIILNTGTSSGTRGSITLDAHSISSTSTVGSIISTSKTTNTVTTASETSGTSANSFLQTGAVSTGQSGVVTVGSGDASGAAGVSGAVNVKSGTSTTGATGLVTILSGASSSGGGTGNVVLGSGNTTDTFTGRVTISTGSASATGGNSGLIRLITGSTQNITSGPIELTTGDSVSGTSGNIVLNTGTGVSRGKIKLQDASTATPGYVWTSTNVDGSGAWAAIPTLNQNTTGTSANVTGIVALANGGTAKALTAVAGGVVYTDADSMEVSAAGTSGQYLTSGGAGAPTWSTPAAPTLNYQISSSSGSYTTTVTASGTQVTNLSVTITTTGRPVVVKCIHDGTTSFNDYSSTQTSASALVQFWSRILRDATVVFYARENSNDSTSTLKILTTTTSVVNTMDIPTAGTYTYKVEVWAQGGLGGTVAFKNTKLIAYEL